MEELAPNQAPRRILVVDDELLVRRAAALALRDEFEVTLATGIEDGLRALEMEDGFSAVVTDLFLGPGRTGIDLLGAIRQSRPTVARVLVSGNATAEIERAAREGLAHSFALKPWQPRELHVALACALRRASAEAGELA